MYWGWEELEEKFLFCASGKFYYLGSSCEPQNWEVWQKESVKIPSNAIVVHGDWWLWWLWCTAEIRRRTHHHWKERWCWFFHQWPVWQKDLTRVVGRCWSLVVIVGYCWWFVKFVHFIFTKRSLVRFLADETKYRETNFSLNLPQLTCSVNVQSACRLACLCRLATEHQKRKIQFC